MIGGFALRDLSRLARKRGFHVINGFAFHTPENYPPMICGGMAMENAPKPGELKRFSRFLSTLDTQLSDLAAGRMVPLRKPGEHFLTALFSAYPRTKARQEMGGKFVDEKLCTQCRTCEKGCPYHAIRLSPFPKFDPAGCYGCWACFHHCPKKAIYTQQFRGRGHYPKPNARLINKLAE
jgi:ferredoxin